MKLKDVKISNILSFSFKNDFSTGTPDIIFDEKLNVIVGANGSGKSNFVEIIFTLFQSYFIESYNYNYAFDSDRDHAPTLIKRADSNNGLILNKHNKFTTEQSKIYISFLVGDADKINLKFIKDNLTELDDIASVYSSGLISFSANLFDQVDIDSITETGFEFTINNDTKNARVSFVLAREEGNKIQELMDFYLKNFDLIKKIVEVGIMRKQKDWNNLITSFEFLGSHRLFSSFPTTLSFSPGLGGTIDNLAVQKKNQNIKNNSNTSPIFEINNARIGNKIRKDKDGPITKEQAIDNQFTGSDASFFKLNELLKEYLNISIRSKGTPPQDLDYLNIELFDCTSSISIDFEELSSGQKSIFTLIFLVITSDLDNGLLMIDEPEIHLHPKLQNKYFQLLKEFSEKHNLQSILITHSPVFIDEKTIKNTFRFYIENGETKVIRPDNIVAAEEELIKFLSYTNSSKIFFTNKVVIVEGDTDSYFFSHVLNNELKTNQEIEFLAIGGKGAYKKWFDFLDKFKIKHYFITDFDFLDNRPEYDTLGVDETRKLIASQGIAVNVISGLDIIPPQTKQQVKEALNSKLEDLINKSLNEITEDDLILIKKGAFLEKQRKIKFLTVTNELEKTPTFQANKERIIDNLRSENIYVLRWGDLEDYLSINQKGLQSVVDYCNCNNFETMEEKLKNDITSITGDILSK